MDDNDSGRRDGVFDEDGIGRDVGTRCRATKEVKGTRLWRQM